MWCTVALHALSVIILLIGLLAATRTGNVAVAGYYSGIIVSNTIRTSVKSYGLIRVRDVIRHELDVGLGLIAENPVFVLLAELRDVLGHRWSQCGGESQTYGELKLINSRFSECKD